VQPYVEYHALLLPGVLHGSVESSIDIIVYCRSTSGGLIVLLVLVRIIVEREESARLSDYLLYVYV